MRSITDDPTSTGWGGGNVYDVYSLAPGKGSNGIPYQGLVRTAIFLACIPGWNRTRIVFQACWTLAGDATD